MNHLENYKKSLETSNISNDHLAERFMMLRKQTIDICKPLKTEDYIVQPCQEVSPPKWHLAHTTWFFEELILVQFKKDYKRFDDSYPLLFNSYYKSAGDHWLQKDRGNLSRPSVEEVYKYREYVNDKVCEFLKTSKYKTEVNFILEVGFHHEQQHQELLYMDIKYILASNPKPPAYKSEDIKLNQLAKDSSWQEYQEGIYQVGHSSDNFAYDNEGPLHKTYIYPFAVQNRTVTNGDFLKFIEDGIYSKPKYWLSEGWDWLNQESITSPLYWRKIDNKWYEYTLYGLKALDLNAPVCHISYFEADAYANWTGCRLPSEYELEIYLKDFGISTSSVLHPDNSKNPVCNLWLWSKSHYSPYPGFRTFKGMLGEYNGKFMCNQFVLKGGAVITPKDHYRHSYRNFYQPQQRWMFSGIRLAKDL